VDSDKAIIYQRNCLGNDRRYQGKARCNRNWKFIQTASKRSFNLNTIG